LSPKCKACGRESEDGELCAYHALALASLKRGFVDWNRAYSGISWKDYLQRVKAIEGTGGWVKEVVGVEEGSVS